MLNVSVDTISCQDGWGSQNQFILHHTNHIPPITSAPPPLQAISINKKLYYARLLAVLALGFSKFQRVFGNIFETTSAIGR